MFYPPNILKRTIVLFFDSCVIDYNDGLSVLEVSEFSEPRGRHLYDTAKQRVAIMKAKEKCWDSVGLHGILKLCKSSPSI